MIKKIFSSLALLSILLLINACGEKVTYAEIETEFGTMKLELYNSTPYHRDNFVKLAKEGFYDDLLFHRVIQGFMIQGGDPQSKNAPAGQPLGSGGPGYQVDAEIGAIHIKGALAAARTGGPGNPEKKSSGSQFYIVQGSKLSPEQLARFEKTKGISYSEDQKKLYQEVGGSPGLDMDYTVYGMVVEGLEVIDKIAAVQTGQGDRPVNDVKMKVRILN